MGFHQKNPNTKSDSKMKEDGVIELWTDMPRYYYYATENYI